MKHMFLVCIELTKDAFLAWWLSGYMLEYLIRSFYGEGISGQRKMPEHEYLKHLPASTSMFGFIKLFGFLIYRYGLQLGDWGICLKGLHWHKLFREACIHEYVYTYSCFDA